MQPLAVNHLRNLLRSHPSVLAGKAVKYSFFYFHLLSYTDISNKVKYIFDDYYYFQKKMHLVNYS